MCLRPIDRFLPQCTQYDTYDRKLGVLIIAVPASVTMPKPKSSRTDAVPPSVTMPHPKSSTTNSAVKKPSTKGPLKEAVKYIKPEPKVLAGAISSSGCGTLPRGLYSFPKGQGSKEKKVAKLLDDVKCCKLLRESRHLWQPCNFEGLVALGMPRDCCCSRHDGAGNQHRRKAAG